MRRLALWAVYIVIGFTAGYGQHSKLADHCTPDGGNGSVRCGGQYASACIALHPDNDEGTGVCQTEDTLPNCCAASPDSADRTATACQCCRKHAQVTSEQLALYGYDAL